MKYAGTALAMTLLFVTAVGTGQQTRSATSQPTTALRTWAVLSSDELRQSGLEDQIIIGLGADKAIILVDREHLAKIAREMKIGRLVDASGAGLRRKAGAFVKADVLVILNLEKSKKQRFIRMVICETRGGARLLVEFIPFEKGKEDQAAKAALEAIARTRQRFSDGVQLVVGVLPFLSRSFSQQYDYLQRGYANLLATTLANYKGVAIIEIEEARLLARELGLSDDKSLRRIVPLLIEGEYKVVPVPGRETPRVTFKIKLTGSGMEDRVLPEHTEDLDHAADYLTSKVPDLIGTFEKSAGSLKPRDQAAVLTTRADAFARLGAWEHSTRLREASLLLQDDPNQRAMIILEYAKIIEQHWWSRKKLTAVQCRDFTAMWYLAMSHLEYLICNEQCFRPEAAGLSDRILWKSRRLERDSEDGISDSIEKTKRRFLWEVFPKVRLLKPISQYLICYKKRSWNPYGKNYKKAMADLNGKLDGQDKQRWSDFLIRGIISNYICVRNSKGKGRKDGISGLDDHDEYLWADTLLNHAIIDYEHVEFKPDDADFIYRILTELIPPDLQPSQNLLLFMKRFPMNPEYGLKPPNKTYLEFLEKLCHSQQPTHRWIGRYGMLRYRWCLERDKLDLSAFQKEIQQLFSDALEIEPHVRGHHQSNVLLSDDVRRMSSFIKKELVASEHKDKLAPMGMEPLHFKLKELSGEVRDFDDLSESECINKFGRHIEEWLSWENKVEILWTRETVAMMREKGLVEVLLASSESGICHVEIGVRYLWVRTRQKGIWVFDSDGRIITHIGRKEGLPAVNTDPDSMKICPVGPGKAVVAGTLGEHDRLWVAMIQVETGQANVKVFHQATKVLLPGEENSKISELELAGKLSGMRLLPANGPDASPTVLLYWGGYRRKIMQIDVNSLKVSLSNKSQIKDMHKLYISEGVYLFRNGRVYTPRGIRIETINAYCRGFRLIENGPEIYQIGRVRKESFSSTHPGKVIGLGLCRWDKVVKDFVYLGLLPEKSELSWFGTSKYYGMVAWSSTNLRFYRLKPSVPHKASASTPASQPAKKFEANAKVREKQSAAAASKK